MLLTRSFRTLLSSSSQLLKRQPSFLRQFSSINTSEPQANPTNSTIEDANTAKDAEMIQFLTKHDLHINDYMRKLNQYILSASALGIGTAHLLSFTVPLGFPSAFLILAGFGLEHSGSHYINRTNPQTVTYKDAEGRIHYTTTNTLKRKLAFVSTCVGYGCIIGSMMSLIPITSTALPLSAAGCLFSTLGHFTYAKYAPKPHFNTTQLFISGLLTGIVGLNLVASGSAIMMLEGALHLENVEHSTYLGLVLYNAFTGHDSQKALEDVQEGKGDNLKQASKFAENWLYSLVPHFLMNM